MSDALLDAARRLMERGDPWLAVSPPRYTEPPVCLGCGVEAFQASEGAIGFVHTPDCAAFDLAQAVMELEDDSPEWTI